MTPNWYEQSLKNHIKFLDTAQAQGRLITREERSCFLALAISGEAGELANLYKKLWRGDGVDVEEFGQKVRMEVADIYTYLRHLSDELGFDLDDAAEEKAAIVEKRLQASSC